MNRRLCAAGVALLLAAAGPDSVTMTPQQQQTIGLHTARAEEKPIVEPVQAPATIGFDPQRVAVLRPLAQARVMALRVQPGDRVSAHQVPATLEIPSLVSMQEQLASAKASVQETEASVAVARDALRRGEILARDGSLSRAEAERRRLVLAQAEAQASTAGNQLAAAQTRVNQFHPGQEAGEAALTSPLDGVVVSVGVTPNEVIDTTTNCFTVADLSSVIALAQVPESGATLVAMGDHATIRTTSGDGRTWDGRVIAVGAALDPQARTLPVRIALENPGGALRAGMFVQATIRSQRGRRDIVVPAAAVQLVGSRHVAFVPLGGDRFQPRNLTLGVQQPDWVEVRTGLKPGDEVVTDGSFALKALLQQAMLGEGG